MSDKLRKAYHAFIIDRKDHYVSKELLFEAGYDYAIKLLEESEDQRADSGKGHEEWLKEQK